MNIKPINVLENIFKELITVQSISQPVEPTIEHRALELCLRNNYDVQLVKNGENEPLLVFDKFTKSTRPLAEEEVISESTPVIEVLETLIDQPWLFVKEKRKITSIVTRADLDSIPVRIWLYGMISLFEIQIRENITNNNIDWEKNLTEARLNAANKLFEDKKSRNEDVNLLSCTQICDLSTIIKKNYHLFSANLGSLSKKELHKDFNEIMTLRDNLAHAQSIGIEWKRVYELMNLIDKVLKF